MTDATVTECPSCGAPNPEDCACTQDMRREAHRALQTPIGRIRRRIGHDPKRSSQEWKDLRLLLHLYTAAKALLGAHHQILRNPDDAHLTLSDAVADLDKPNT